MSEDIVFLETFCTRSKIDEGVFTIVGLLNKKRVERSVEIGKGRIETVSNDDSKYKKWPKHIPLPFKEIMPFSLCDIPQWKEVAKKEITIELTEK